MVPYLSVVVTSRNDNHGGDLNKRTQIFLDALAKQVTKSKLATELIMVEWNPPADRPPLAEELSWPEGNEYFSWRIITVPSELHGRFRFADRLPLFQMIAKNVGIRRARADYILCTNIDIIFSNELFEYFRAHSLESGKIYRVNRYDVDEEVPVGVPLQSQLDYCETHLIRVNHRYGTVSTVTGEYDVVYPDDVDHEYYDWCPLPLNTNASGDFQLLHKSDWERLEGYPELALYSLHIDTIFQFQAHYGGCEEISLRDPYRIYHVEHTGGWNPEVNKDKSFEKAYKKKKIDMLTFEDVKCYVQQMWTFDKPIKFNEEDWGLVGEDLNEIGC